MPATMRFMTLLNRPLLLFLGCLAGACGGKASSNEGSNNGEDALLDSHSGGTSATETGAGGSAQPVGSGGAGPGLIGGSGGSELGGAASGGASSGGASAETGGNSGVPTHQVGHIEESCGGFMWSIDQTEFLDCTVGGDQEFHPDCVIVDCTSGGDPDANCVFSNHCWCSAGFKCDGTSISGGECEPRIGCVPE